MPLSLNNYNLHANSILNINSNLKQIFNTKGSRFKKINEMAASIKDRAFTISCFAIAAITDLLVLPGAGALVLVELIKKDFNPSIKNIKKDKTPILLLHGSGFCQAQWVVAHQYLKDDAFGSVFSCSYAESLLGNHPDSGIEDYAARKVRQQIQEIKKKTGQNKIIIIGHSMGSMVGEAYAQNHAIADGIQVTNILSISSPWQGSPTIDLVKFLKGKRYQQMSVASCEKEQLNFRLNLVAKAKQADKEGERRHWNIWSQHDFAVPGQAGRLTDDVSRQAEFLGVGHYSPMVHIGVLRQMHAWVKRMYKLENC